MKIKEEVKKEAKKTLKFQAGGQAPAAPQGGGDPSQGGDPNADQGAQQMEQIAQQCMQALQSGDCNLAMQVCQTLAGLLQQSQGGQQAPQGEPVYKRGGGIARRI